VTKRLSKLWLAGEYTVGFFGLPAAVTLSGRSGPVIPLLLAVFLLCLLVLLRTRGFDRRRLWNGAPMGREARRFVPRFLILAAAIAAGVALLRPASLFGFPRRAPELWALVMVLYPLVSVYPQEVVFRAFLFERYRPLFGEGVAVVWASALAFAWVHIVFENWIAVAMTLVGGWMFADTYRRSQSLAASALEHALYGCLVFTIGLGRHFYKGW
jgi:CAAX protease family protein